MPGGDGRGQVCRCWAAPVRARTQRTKKDEWVGLSRVGAHRTVDADGAPAIKRVDRAQRWRLHRGGGCCCERGECGETRRREGESGLKDGGMAFVGDGLWLRRIFVCASDATTSGDRQNKRCTYGGSTGGCCWGDFAPGCMQLGRGYLQGTTAGGVRLPAGTWRPTVRVGYISRWYAARFGELDMYKVITYLYFKQVRRYGMRGSQVQDHVSFVMVQYRSCVCARENLKKTGRRNRRWDQCVRDMFHHAAVHWQDRQTWHIKHHRSASRHYSHPGLRHRGRRRQHPWTTATAWCWPRPWRTPHRPWR